MITNTMDFSWSFHMHESAAVLRTVADKSRGDYSVPHCSWINSCRCDWDEAFCNKDQCCNGLCNVETPGQDPYIVICKKAGAASNGDEADQKPLEELSGDV